MTHNKFVSSSIFGLYFLFTGFFMMLYIHDSPWTVVQYYALILISFTILTYFDFVGRLIIAPIRGEVHTHSLYEELAQVDSFLNRSKGDISFSLAYACWLPIMFVIDFHLPTFHAFYWGVILLCIIISVFTYIFKLELKTSALVILNSSLIKTKLNTPII
jgi:hypothetical protein